MQVLPHGKDHRDVWVNTSLIEIIHNNWPDTIVHMKSGLSCSTLTLAERLTLRKKNVNANIAVSDGAVYFSPGGGRMSNGASITDFMELQRIYRDLDSLEAFFAQEEEQIKQKIASKNGNLSLRVDCSNTQKLCVIEEKSKTLLNITE